MFTLVMISESEFSSMTAGWDVCFRIPSTSKDSFPGFITNPWARPREFLLDSTMETHREARNQDIMIECQTR